MSLIRKCSLFLAMVILYTFSGCKDPVSADNSTDEINDITDGTPSGDTVVVDVDGWGPDQIDSLFALLVERVQRIESVDSYSDYELIDFKSLRDGFQSYLAGKDADLTKANIGYIVSALLALNTSPKVGALADSLDMYLQEMDEYYGAEAVGGGSGLGGLSRTSANTGADRITIPRNSMRHMYDRHGVRGLGQLLLANTPKLLAAQTTYPTIPRMITISYIQSAIESEMLPTLNRIVAACERLEKKSTVFLTVSYEGDAYEIDKADVYAMDAGTRLLRGAMYLLTAYEMDLYTSQNDQSNSWIDSLMEMDKSHESSSYTEYTYSGDTLFQRWHYGNLDEATFPFLARMFRYNWERDGFLTLRRQNHQKCHKDLLAVPVLIKKGIAEINNESDEQKGDLIPGEGISRADSNLLDLSQEMLELGYTNQMARRFRSLESLMDFVTEVLNGPVEVNETVNDVTINMTIDISAFFKNPIQDLRTLYPRFQWRPEDSIVTTRTDTSHIYSYGKYASFSYCSYYDSTVVNIAQTEIDSIVEDDWNDCVEVYLKSGYTTRAYIDDYKRIQLIDLVDDQGYVVDIESEFEHETFFPYFADYTFNGIFPGMTRERWIQLVWQ